MANRNDSDTRQHETLPGFGPSPGPHPSPHQSLDGGDLRAGVRPVEQMVDAAIERIAREQGASRQLELQRERGLSTPGLVKANVHAVPTRLRWKGHDVSDEFREYAERIANGEDLPPFEGRVLAEPNPAFPWGTPPAQEAVASKEGTGSKVALLGSAVVALGLFAWALMPRGEADRGAGLQPAPSSEPSSTAAPVPTGVAMTGVADTETRAALEPQTTEVATAALLPAPLPEAPESADAVAAMHSSVAPPGTDVPATTAPALPVAPAAGSPSATPPPSPRPVAPAASAPVAAVKSVPQDDFGIMQLDEPVTSPASSASTPSVPAAKTVTPAGASVGDMSRVGQGPTGAVRKEPGSESSAKGSLLVETPSF